MTVTAALYVFAIAMVVAGLTILIAARARRDHVNQRRATFTSIATVLAGISGGVAAITPSARDELLIVVAAILLVEVITAPRLGPRRTDITATSASR